MIPVILRDGRCRKVFPPALDGLLDAGRVMLFKRSDGWVLVGHDPTRSGSGGRYQGPERRASRLQGSG